MITIVAKVRIQKPTITGMILMRAITVRIGTTAAILGLAAFTAAAPAGANEPATGDTAEINAHQQTSQDPQSNLLENHWQTAVTMDGPSHPASEGLVSSGAPVTPDDWFAPSGPDVKSVQESVENPIPLAECHAEAGATCAISRGVESSWSVSGSGGVDFGALNASVGGGYQESVSETVTCNSPALAWNQKFVVVARGTFVIFDWVTRIVGVETGREQSTAFLPTGYGCTVVTYK